jgi:hypothetical protein
MPRPARRVEIRGKLIATGMARETPMRRMLSKNIASPNARPVITETAMNPSELQRGIAGGAIAQNGMAISSTRSAATAVRKPLTTTAETLWVS